MCSFVICFRFKSIQLKGIHDYIIASRNLKHKWNTHGSCYTNIMSKKILVTGGTGYIGSHTVVELLNAGHEVEILDNLFNSKIEVLDKIEQLTGTKPKFHQVDLLDYAGLKSVFTSVQFDSVIHFAGLKAVGESVEKPLEYYENNVGGTINLLKCMRETKDSCG